MTGIADIRRCRKGSLMIALQLRHMITSLVRQPCSPARAVQQALARRRHNDHVATVFLDLDHFKTVNDTPGHATGDHLLQQVAKRITRTRATTTHVARLGGDEFAVILPTSHSRKAPRSPSRRSYPRCRPPSRGWA